MKQFIGYQTGMNLGGWLSQCRHTTEHYKSFIQEDDIKELASWGLDHVRLPIDYEVILTDDGQYLEEGFHYIDSCLSWCQTYGLNLVLDLHKAPGYSFTASLVDATTSNCLFEDEDMQNRFINLWATIAKRYASFGTMVAFELLNELLEETKEWNSLSLRTIKAIREHAPITSIIVGGIHYNSIFSLPTLEVPYDENIVHNFHFYEPMLFTHQNAPWVHDMPKNITIPYPAAVEDYKKHKKHLGYIESMMYSGDYEKVDITVLEPCFQTAAALASERNVALYCGEYGVIESAPVDSTLNWYTDMNTLFTKYNIGRAAWTYKLMDFGLINEHYAPVFHELIKKL